jgi:DNA repair exonuclease SbcCD ATPase subunit
LIARYFGRDNENKPDTVMSFETFKTCVDKLPKGTRIDFSGMAEPWLNPDCTQMVLYAGEQGFPIAIYSTLVGMSKEDFNKIKELKCEEFVVHIPDDKSNAHIEVTKEYIELLEEVMKYEQSDGCKLVTGVSCHAGIHPDIKEAIPSNSKLITEIHNRAGNIENDYVESKENKGEIICINCEDDVHHNVLLPDGTVLLCCMDYGMKHILGNLLMQSYEDIHKSEEARRVQSGLKDDSVDILCRKCVNARNIHEVYEEYKLFADWQRNLSLQYDQRMKELADYEEWVKKLEKKNNEIKAQYRNLEKQNNEIKTEYHQVTEQYDQRIEELKDYKEWVNNLEKQNNEIKTEYHQVTEQYDQRMKELADYKEWVKKLEKQNDEIKTEYHRVTEQYDQRIKELKDYKEWVNNLEKQNDEITRELSAYKDKVDNLEKQNSKL